ncbi:MAG: class GN sortase [Thalassotalea sp.]
MAEKKLATTLVILALCLSAEPLYMLSKAFLAQHLLAKAWQETLLLKAQNSALVDSAPATLTTDLTTTNSDNTISPWSWADTYPVGKLTLLKKAKQAEKTWIVLSGFSGRTMAFGPAWLQDSAAPNQSGNTVISAHNDSHFNILAKVELGDLLSFESADGQNRQYQINSINIVTQNDNSAYQFIDETIITLITCYPFTVSREEKTQRLIVQAIAL